MTAISLIVALYGLLWILSSLATISGLSTPKFWVLLGPYLGLSLLLVSLGLWRLQWPAWTLAVLIFGSIILWEVMQITAINLDSIPILPILVVGYLFFRQDLYFRSRENEAK